jgi:hypothetical protein
LGYASVTIGATSTLIVQANPQRLSLLLYNNGPDSLIIAPDASVTSSPNSITIAKGGNLTEDSGGHKVYSGAFYGISAGTGNAVVSYWERIGL